MSVTLKKAIGFFDCDREITSAINAIAACDKRFDEILKSADLINISLYKEALVDSLPKFKHKSACCCAIYCNCINYFIKAISPTPHLLTLHLLNIAFLFAVDALFAAVQLEHDKLNQIDTHMRPTVSYMA